MHLGDLAFYVLNMYRNNLKVFKTGVIYIPHGVIKIFKKSGQIDSLKSQPDFPDLVSVILYWLLGFFADFIRICFWRKWIREANYQVSLLRLESEKN